MTTLLKPNADTLFAEEYDWEFICRDNQRDEDGKRWYGHSFWRDRNSGRISIRDMSGSRPHLTDDGILWLDFHRPWEITNFDSQKHYVMIPVFVARDHNRPSHCLTPLSEGIALSKKLDARLVIDGSSELGKLLPALKECEIV